MQCHKTVSKATDKENKNRKNQVDNRLCVLFVFKKK